MTEIRAERLTAEVESEFVVFLIGMRFNRVWKVWRWGPVALVMARMIREYYERTGFAVGFKPAGGIRAAKGALEYLYLMKEELGDRWLRADLFRFGASALLTDIERQLEHFVTGRYAAAYRHPMP